MYWLARPPYLRQIGAWATLVVAIWIELAPTTTVLHPYARVALASGTLLESDHFEMQPIPAGILPPIEIEGVLNTPLAPGDPLTASMIAASPMIPTGWWGLDVPVPAGVGNGSEVRLMVDDPPRMVPGIVVRQQESDGFEGPVALVAIPEGEAAAAAAAVRQGNVAVLVGSVTPDQGG